MKKILIAIDNNPFCQNVAETGFALARDLKVECCIIHVIADISHYFVEYSPIMGFEGFSSDSAFKSLSEQQIEAKGFLDAVKMHLGNRNIGTKVLTGNPADTILQYACEYKADIIVIGAHSHHSFELLSLGNTASAVIKHAEVPILVVPADSRNTSKPDQQIQSSQYF